MTYCIGIMLNEGLVLASDSRTNAGIDRVSTFRKMHVLEKRGERFFALLTAGNLSLTQGVMSLLGERLDTGDPEKDLWAVGSMFAAARVVGMRCAMGDTIYFQIGEVKYGKPILDRIIQSGTSLNDAVKDALIFFDSTMLSNVSVGPPIPRPCFPRVSSQGRNSPRRCCG